MNYIKIVLTISLHKSPSNLTFINKSINQVYLKIKK